MTKIGLFMRLYRNKAAENGILFLLYVILSTIVSMVLFVQDNNRMILEAQLYSMDIETSEMLIEGTENVLGVIAVFAMIIGMVGIVILIAFRNNSGRKTQVMLRIFGMKEKDLFIKASLDAAIFGIAPSVMGFLLGYRLFRRFTEGVMEEVIVSRLTSVSSAVTLLITGAFVMALIFGGNLYCDMQIMDSPITETLYGRKGKGKRKRSLIILIALSLFVAKLALAVFHVSSDVIKIFAFACALIFCILFAVFSIFFGKAAKRIRKKRKLQKTGDIGFFFLCSRSRRDALLAIVISVGTVLMCLAANIIFNTEEMLLSAYRDNLGYSILLRVDDPSDTDGVIKALYETNTRYTFAYSKLCSYDEYNIPHSDATMFYALVIVDQTDGNEHFFVPAGSFYTDRFFANQSGLMPDDTTDMFGERINYLDVSDTVQYLSLVNYNVIINISDWHIGIDDTWIPIFLIDASAKQEKIIREATKPFSCHIESAAELINEIMNMCSDYISLIMLVLVMIVIVTASIFYTVIRTDIESRKTELYLYRVFGASRKRASRVIFSEYIMIALISSLAVSFTVMLCGELYFYLALKRHYPLSLPVITLTTAAAVLFVAGCCATAGFINGKRTKTEVIRDE